ncbi:L-gulonolactone oxidase 3 [Abeliophyllum distichum]|uniref:L-gulonolactone oxidase 3 n=1 Tax=Abeliophyllum distichum TaxID=126358 RepID=A0ABD1TYM1_9LAMI
MATQGWLLRGLVFVICGTALIHGMPPQNPVRCNQNGCVFYNSYGVWGDRKDCKAPTVVYPTTEEELRLAVANANKNNVKVKVVTKFSHSIPKLACPMGNAVLISTERYNSIINVDVDNLSVTADAGVSLRNLIDRVEQRGVESRGVALLGGC